MPLMSYDEGHAASNFQDLAEKRKYQTIDKPEFALDKPPTGARPMATGLKSPSQSAATIRVLMLDWESVLSTSTWTSYQLNQIDVIRKHAEPRQFHHPATSMGFFFDGFDHYTITEPLNLSRPGMTYVGSGHVDPRHITVFAHDLTRGFKRKELLG